MYAKPGRLTSLESEINMLSMYNNHVESSKRSSNSVPSNNHVLLIETFSREPIVWLANS